MRGKPSNVTAFDGQPRITPADAGKTITGYDPTMSGTGSPPRMRGKLYCFACGAGGDGITPADAGKTVAAGSACAGSGDHPRGCGENMPLSTQWRADMGSPPRMRGKLRNDCQIVAQARITPADAGKTRYPRRRNRNRQDHPRGCGENLEEGTKEAVKYGSPPRMRGKRNALPQA